MRACSEARRSRNWDCTESGSCTSVSTSVSTLAARRPRALETYSAHPRCVPTAVNPSSWCAIRAYPHLKRSKSSADVPPVRPQRADPCKCDTTSR